MKKTIIFIILFFGLSLTIYKLNTSNLEKSSENISVSYKIDNNIFSAEKIPNYIYENMIGKSIPYQYQNTVDINSLSFLKITYFGFDNKYMLEK